MIKWVLQDYFSMFRWTNIRKPSNAFWIFYFLFLFPLLINASAGKTYFLAYYMIWIPIIFCLHTNSALGKPLSKIMFLCPLNRDTREKYIITSSILRMLVPILLQGLLFFIGFFLPIANPICMVGILVNNISLSLIAGSPMLYMTAQRRSGKNFSKIGSLSFSTYGCLEMGIMTITLLTGFVYPHILTKSLATWLIILIVIIPSILPIPMVIKSATYWKSCITYALDYEISHTATSEKSR